jgi:hypothetical protein
MTNREEYEIQYPMSNKEYPMTKGKQDNFQDRVIGVAVRNPQLDSLRWILDIPCWTLDIRFFIQYPTGNRQ